MKYPYQHRGHSHGTEKEYRSKVRGRSRKNSDWSRQVTRRGFQEPYFRTERKSRSNYQTSRWPRSKARSRCVLWEFSLAGIKFRVVIQAKDWKKKVSLPAIDTFANVLRDLPGQPRGIIVTKRGIQSGGVDYARAHGIEIFDVADPNPKEFPADQTPKLEVTFAAVGHRIRQIRVATEPPIDFDAQGISSESDFVKLELVDESTGERREMKELIELAQELCGKQVGIQTWIKEPKGHETEDWYELDLSDKQLMIRHGGKGFHLLKLLVLFQARLAVDATTITNTVAYVLRLATNDATYTVDTNFQVRKFGEPLELYGPIVDMRTLFHDDDDAVDAGDV